MKDYEIIGGAFIGYEYEDLCQCDKLTERVLALDVGNMSQEQINWLHRLKNRVASVQMRNQLDHIRREQL